MIASATAIAMRKSKKKKNSANLSLGKLCLSVFKFFFILSMLQGIYELPIVPTVDNTLVSPGAAGNRFVSKIRCCKFKFTEI